MSYTTGQYPDPPSDIEKALGHPLSPDTTTHRNLLKEVEEGRFRQDLYYRLAIVPILVPPLRERAEDIPELADYLLRRIASELKISRRSLHPDVLRRLMSYSFLLSREHPRVPQSLGTSLHSCQ
jgi:hypothetical protein